MTANELADEVMEHYKAEAPRGFNVNWMEEVAIMLRQQAQEIEELRIQIANEEESYMLLNEYCLCAKESNKQLTEKIETLKKELALQRLSDISQKIENEPVAWAYIDELDNICEEGDWQINVTKTKEYSNQIGLFAYPNEDRDSAIYATGYWKGIEKAKEKNETLDTRSYLIGRYDGLEKDELKQLVKSFFEDYLDYQEESDSGRLFNPIHVSCTRVMMIEPLAKLLVRMRELSGVKE
jgi:hypothetical protein